MFAETEELCPTCGAYWPCECKIALRTMAVLEQWGGVDFELAPHQRRVMTLLGYPVKEVIETFGAPDPELS